MHSCVGGCGCACEDLIDESYCHLWAEYSKQKIDELTFMRLHRDGLLCVVAQADLDAVLAARGSWDTVAANLTALTDGAQIGRKLFQRACEAMVSEKLSIRIGTLIDQVPRALTKASVAAMHNQLKAFLEAQAFSLPNKRRKISLTFGHLPVDLVVGGAKEEFDLRLSALILSSTAPGALVLLPFEEGLPRIVGGHPVGHSGILSLACVANVGWAMFGAVAETTMRPAEVRMRCNVPERGGPPERPPPTISNRTSSWRMWRWHSRTSCGFLSGVALGTVRDSRNLFD